MDRFLYFNNVCNEVVGLDNPDFFNSDFTMPVIIIREVEKNNKIFTAYCCPYIYHLLLEKKRSI